MAGLNTYRALAPTPACHTIFGVAVGLNTTSSAGFCTGPLPNHLSMTSPARRARCRQQQRAERSERAYAMGHRAAPSASSLTWISAR